jgi:hypothetical protein
MKSWQVECDQEKGDGGGEGEAMDGCWWMRD